MRSLIAFFVLAACDAQVVVVTKVKYDYDIVVIEEITDTGGVAATDTVDSDDSDGDGYDEGEDCDDNNAAINPDAEEICDGLDNDCDGLSDSGDDSIVDGRTFYLDRDGDGHGSTPIFGCEPPHIDWVDTQSDCDDANSTINPDMEEICGDNVDNDCDGETDEATWYFDNDGDGYGAEASGTTLADTCLDAADGDLGGSADWITVSGDCDDNDALVNPDAVEICGDNVDNDCDGDSIDVGALYPDVDGDGSGDSWATMIAWACEDEVPTGTVWADALDCDDSDANIGPNMAEVSGDNVDNDCDGLVE